MASNFGLGDFDPSGGSPPQGGYAPPAPPGGGGGTPGSGTGATPTLFQTQPAQSIPPEVWVMLMKRMGMHMEGGGGVPGQGGGDTVPAMLTPGEFVVNAQAASHPVIRALLAHINAQSAHHLHHMASGGPVRGYAQGGLVGGASWMPRFPVQGGGGGGNNGYVHPGPSSQYQGTGMGINQYQPPNSGIDGFNPGAANGWSNMSPTQGALGTNSIYDLLNQYGQQGSFGPQGSAYVRDAVMRQAGQNAADLQHQAYSAANLYGGDPAMQAYAGLQGSLNSLGGQSDALNNANLGLLMNQQQFAQGLYGQQLGAINQQNQGNWDYIHQRLLMDAQNGAHKNDALWGALGQLGGSAIGALPGGKK